MQYQSFFSCLELDLFALEKEAKSKGYTSIAGVYVDGLGALAGPLVIATCILDKNFKEEKLESLEALSDNEMRSLQVKTLANKHIIYAIEVVEITQEQAPHILPILQTAIEQTVSSLSVPADFLLIGGPYNPFPSRCSKVVLSGQNISYTIACAALLAKATRNEIMSGHDTVWPEYGFAKNKGYPTPLHHKKIEEHGLSPLHFRVI